MKYTTLLITTAALVFSISAANSQNQPPQPSIAGVQSTVHSGPRVSGGAKFCSETAGGGLLRCRYHSMEACQKSKAPRNLRCVARPSS
jgi:hypothetical protein